MPRIGLILACEHYPAVDTCPTQMDAQLRYWLESCGHSADAIKVYHAYHGELPETALECDAFIVSGTAVQWLDAGSDWRGILLMFLRAAAALNVPVYGLNRGEHIVHDALSKVGAPAPATPTHLRAIRNPFRSFHTSDTLHAFDAATRTVKSLERPRSITTPSMLRQLLAA